jgi:(p)ppGpp synthase/HD superfamily hydrolase
MMEVTMSVPYRYSGSLEHAIVLAAVLHAGQVDKAGEPYILHCLEVALSMRSIDAKIVAVLHDTVEDTGLELADLVSSGFSEEVTNAIEALTKRHHERYLEDYITRVIDGGRLAIIVKMADLDHNLDKSRIPNPTDADAKRHKKYEEASRLLVKAYIDLVQE